MSSPCRHRDGRGEAGDMLIHGKTTKRTTNFETGQRPKVAAGPSTNQVQACSDPRRRRKTAGWGNKQACLKAGIKEWMEGFLFQDESVSGHDRASLFRWSGKK